MQENIEIKHNNIKKYIIDLANKLNEEKANTISEETINKGIEIFTSSKYDNYSLEQIIEEINNLIQQMLEEREKREYLKQNALLKLKKIEELKRLYEQSKEKYGNVQYEIKSIIDANHVQSYNETKEVQLIGPSGEIVNGFYKGGSSPNEYELLVSRIGKIVNIPVADYSLCFNNDQIEGLSISCIPDKDRYEFLSGYDFVKQFPDVLNAIQNTKEQPQELRPELTRDQTQYYMDLLLKGFKERVSDITQLEKLKKAYFETVLFNLILDQKDYNYTNFAVLYDKLEDYYEMAPLFDNGAVKENPPYEGTMITTFGRSKKEDIIDLLYTEYYDCISDFSKKLEIENQKRINGEQNIISEMFSCIGDTLTSSDANKYCQVVDQTLSVVLEREKLKNDVQDIYYQSSSNDRSKDIKGKVYIISPNPSKGFNCGYSLFIPDGCQVDTTLLVHSCNTGGRGVVQGKVRQNIESRIAIHLSEANEAARLSTIEFNSGMWFGSDLKMPVLTPLIPRVDGYYTQALGSNVYNNNISNLVERNNERAVERRLSESELQQIQEQCKNLPEQLTKMIKDSKNVIQSLGINIDDKVIMEGYSAGSKFASCYTALHPEMVKACICGGTSGLGILPVNELNGQQLNFPLGVANIPNFDFEQFKSIPQLHYIGNSDFNDPAEIKGEKQYNPDGSINFITTLDQQGQIQGRYKENYTQHELVQIHTLLGKNPQERFINNQNLYSQFGINAQFKTFEGDHNSVTQQKNENGEFITNEAVKDFVKEVISKEKKDIHDVESKKCFDQRSNDEVLIANQIKEKNMSIKQQKENKQNLDKPKVKTLTKSTSGNGVPSSSGFTNILTIALIVSFVAGALTMLIYYLCK